MRNQIKFMKKELLSHIRKNINILLVWSISCLTGVGMANAQDAKLINGVVLNSLNEPIAGVSVGIEKSTELPAVTNEKGEFSVKSASGNDWLNIEPDAAYKAKRVNLNNRLNLTIYLARKNSPSGNDPLNILSNTVLKRNLAGSGTILNLKHKDESPALSVDQLMQGIMPGLNVTGISGDPGGGTHTLTRGINSINATNTPLYVIDGLPMSTFNVIQSNLKGYNYNPLLSITLQDISELTFIKDPAYTAAYGSKASNGLVLISTLDPSATKTVIDLDVRTGYSLTPQKRLTQLKANQHKKLISQVLFSSGKQEEIIKKEYPNLFLTNGDDRFIDYQHETDWQSMIFDEAFFKNINVNIKGGDEIAKYGLSVGYVDAEGIVKSTFYKGYNLRFVSMANIYRWLKINSGVSMTYNQSGLKESAQMGQTSPVLTALAKSPMLNPYSYDEEGRELKTLSPVDELGVSNPLAIVNKFDAKNTSFNFSSNFGANARINKDLVFNTNFGLSYHVIRELIFMPAEGMELYYNKEAYNVAKGNNNSLVTFFNNSYLLYNKSIGNHKMSFNTGANMVVNRYEFDWGLAKNAARNDEYRTLSDGTQNLRELGGDNHNWNWLSAYESMNYSYLDKYLVNASLSIDGSSRIGDNAKNTIKIGNVPLGIFYGIGAGWRLSSENFLSSVNWLEELKLRISYGKTGNDDIGESSANNYYNSVKYRQVSGLYKALIPNKELTYETVSQLNAGLDVSLWGDRFTTNIDVYSSTTNDMLLYKPIDAFLGYDFRPENGGQMRNTGIDMGFNFRIFDKPSFSWDIEGSLSLVKNKITEQPGSGMVTEIRGAEIVNEKGFAANSFYGYVFEGVYSTTEEAVKANLVDKRFNPYQAGDAKFKDISGPNGKPDGMINSYDKTVIGSSMPEHFGGLRNTFNYKQWSLSIFMQYVAGNEIYNYVRFENESMSGLENQSANVLNRWQHQGQITNVPRARWADPQGNSAFSSRWIEDGSYLKLREISLNYTLDKEFLAFKKAKFYVSASNLLTFTNYLGYDPEVSYSRRQIDQGIDYGLTPQPRQFIFGAKFGF